MKDNISEYVRLVTQWGIVVDCGDSQLANDIHDQVQHLYSSVAESIADESLVRLTQHNDDAVRLFAASHLKERNLARVIPVYESLQSSSRPFISLSARYIVREIKSSRP